MLPLRQLGAAALEPLLTGLDRYDLLLRPLPARGQLLVLGRLARRRMTGLLAPRSVEIGLTYRCQARCDHCGVAGQARSDSPELTDREVLDLVHQARAMGTHLVILGGGEPLLHPRAIELVGRITAAGMAAAMSTNGLALDRAVAAALRRARVSFVNISLDSSDPGLHDARRGVEGAFDLACAAVRACAAAGVSALVSTCFNGSNLADGDLVRLVALARGLGARGVRLLPEAAAGARLGCSHWVMTPDERRQVEALLDPRFVYLEGIRNQGGECNAALLRFIYISPHGLVQPCSFVPVSFGDTRSHPLDQIWRRLVDHPFYGGVQGGECIMRQAAVGERISAEASGCGALPLEL